MSKGVLVIGGSGFADRLKGTPRQVETPFGRVDLLVSQIGDKMVHAIKRHGETHGIPPHKVNYKANISAAKKVGADIIITTSAVGVIGPEGIEGYNPRDLILCRDILAINATLNGSPITFFDSFEGTGPKHTDMSEVFNQGLNSLLFESARELGLSLKYDAVFAYMAGPRYETPAEIKAIKAMGANLVGMTAPIEAILARELGIPYAVVAIGTNWAAGISKTRLSHPEVEQVMKEKGEELFRLLSKAIERL